MLCCHWTTPRLLNDSSLCNLMLSLKVRCSALTLIPSVDSWWLPYHRVCIPLSLFLWIVCGYGVSYLNFIWTATYGFIILLLLKHSQRSRCLTYVLQILRLHHYMLLVRIRNKLHWLLNRVGLPTTICMLRSTSRR